MNAVLPVRASIFLIIGMENRLRYRLSTSSPALARAPRTPTDARLLSEINSTFRDVLNESIYVIRLFFGTSMSGTRMNAPEAVRRMA